MSGETQTTDPFLRLREHAAKRLKMTKAELLEDAKWGDEAYINASTEASMEQAYREALDKHLREAHGCNHDRSQIADGGLNAEELHPNAPWNIAGVDR